VPEATAVRVEVHDGLATVVLDRPRRKNALDLADWDALCAAFDAIAEDPLVRVVVVRGAGGDFSAGADLSGTWFDDVGAEAAMARIARAAEAIVRLPKPTIARVDGVAYGAGLNLALACDLTVVAEDARLCQVFVRRGLVVDFGGSWLVSRLVGLAQAKRLTLLAPELSGREAAEMGLVAKSVPTDALDGVVERWVAELRVASRRAVALTKRLVLEGSTSTFEAALEAEGRAQAEALAGPDAHEALAAFLEHRPPRFA